ncbi:MAG: hypothetical protein AB1498_07975 [bacterium]
MSTSIEKTSIVALAGIFIAVISLFWGGGNKKNNSAPVHIEKVVSPSTGELNSKALMNLDSGRSFFAKSDFVRAISEYRRAVEIEPDYIDERTGLFLGDEIKDVIKKTIFELTGEEKKTPADKIIRQGLKDAYYLRRRFGRGCE